MSEALKIVVIDDEESVREVVRAYLEKDHFQVFVAANGRDGLALAERHQPDLIILDLMLPDVSGEEICHEVRSRSDVPILMLTAKASEEERIAGLVAGADDYAMLYEVLKRRYEKKKDLPGLIVVDGGKGQAGVAVSVLRELGIGGVDVIGLAKERQGVPPGKESRRTGAGKERFKGEDRVYQPRKKEPIYVSRWPAVLFLLQRMRDEAHRFAISYYRKVKEKEDLQSLLDDIPGIGEKKKKDLLTFFGDVGKVRRASPDDLRKVKGIGPSTAERIRGFLQRRSE